jgi:SOS-response transcriptional repressor LexA
VGKHESHNPLDDDAPSTREQIFDYLIRYKKKHDGNTPSNRRIAQDCHVSPSTVAHHLARLERANRIRLSDDEYRSIEIVDAEWVPPRTWDSEAGGQEGCDNRFTETDRTAEDSSRETQAGRVRPRET